MYCTSCTNTHYDFITFEVYGIRTFEYPKKGTCLSHEIENLSNCDSKTTCLEVIIFFS